jgi:hypothetical protein
MPFHRCYRRLLKCVIVFLIRPCFIKARFLKPAGEQTPQHQNCSEKRQRDWLQDLNPLLLPKP